MEDRFDSINSPKHYTVGGIEVWDYIKAKLTQEELLGYLKGNMFKYLSRARHKGDAIEDYLKFLWYSNRLREEIDKWLLKDEI